MSWRKSVSIGSSRRPATSTGIFPNRAVGPANGADVALVFGLRGIRVEDPSQIEPALRDALASDETVVADVAANIDCRAPEPWLPEGV